MRTPFLLTCLLVATACGAQPKTAPAPLHAGKVLLLEHPGEMAAGLQRVIPGAGFQSWSQPADPAILPAGFGLLLFR